MQTPIWVIIVAYGYIYAPVIISIIFFVALFRLVNEPRANYKMKKQIEDKTYETILETKGYHVAQEYLKYKEK